MTRLLFLDTETTGLNPNRNEIWEVGLIVRDYSDVEVNGKLIKGGEVSLDKEYHWFLPANLDTADLIALNIGKYFERHPVWSTTLTDSDNISVSSYRYFAREFMDLSINAYLVGNVISFDAAFLTALLQRNNFIPAWNYHLVDCEALVAGKYGIQPPWNSKEISHAVGIDSEGSNYTKHEALSDARWARDLYDKVMNNEINQLERKNQL